MYKFSNISWQDHILRYLVLWRCYHNCIYLVKQKKITLSCSLLKLHGLKFFWGGLLSQSQFNYANILIRPLYHAENSVHLLAKQGLF